ncbi:MAG TPA: YceI family protein [Candidatus Polarisedimenticolaceae bacterium]|nr:YceI family protein [Candidatus Polarisedimenticolaceae bacterium]
MTALFLALALAAAEPVPTAERVYRVNPAKADAGFDLKATMHTVHGHTNQVRGEVRVRDEAGGALAMSGTIEIVAATLETGNASRDKTMRGESLAVEQYPVITLAPERFDPKTGTLTGTLTIRGVTKPTTIALTLDRQADRVTATGTFDVPWLDFGVPDPSFAIVRVEKIAHARFSAEFVRVSP